MLSKEFKVGLLALVSGLILYFGFKFLKGSDVFSSTNTYYAVYENIDGLQISNPVMIHGLSVGRVSDISILQSRNNKLLVAIEVDEDIKLGKSTISMLADGGLLGGKMIDLQISNDPPFLAEDDTLASEITQGLTALLQDKAMPVLADFDSTIITFKEIASEYRGFGKDVKALLQKSGQTMDGINALMANNQAKINSILRNLDTLSGSLAETGKELKPLIAKLNSLTDSLNEVQIGVLANKLEGNLDELQKTMTAINEAEGSLGLLIKDDSLYRNMNATMAHLDSLVVDLQENPKKYIPNISVFGGGKNK